MVKAVYLDSEGRTVVNSECGNVDEAIAYLHDTDCLPVGVMDENGLFLTAMVVDLQDESYWPSILSYNVLRREGILPVEYKKDKEGIEAIITFRKPNLSDVVKASVRVYSRY